MIVKLALKKINTLILDTLFPIYCLGCGKEGKWICKDCFKKIKLLKNQACPFCNGESKTGARCFNCRNKSELDGVIAAVPYLGEEKKMNLAKEAIHTFKYRFVKDLAHPLSRLMIDQLKSRKIIQKEKPIPFGPEPGEDKLVVPVPLHSRRLNWRGFNQAELLAENIARHLGLRFDSSILMRQKNNIPQAEIKARRERMENIKDAFVCTEASKTKGKLIILVDDICTTSATLSECAKALKKSGAREVWGAVAARG